MATTRRQRIVRALTPKRVRKIQARWKRRAKKITKARARVRSVWHGDVVINGRRPDRRKKSSKQPASRKPAATQPQRRPVPPKKVQLPQPPNCDGTCTNSNMEPAEATSKGLCTMCCGRKELVTNFGGKHVHVSCGECDGSGLASVARLRAAKKHGGGIHGSEASSSKEQPSRAEAARKTGPWLLLANACLLVFAIFGGGIPLAIAGLGCAAVGAAAYRYERTHGVSEHNTRTGRKAARQAARQAGCSAACMWSIKPADTCRCPCGGTTHGTAHKRKAAA